MTTPGTDEPDPVDAAKADNPDETDARPTPAGTGARLPSAGTGARPRSDGTDARPTSDGTDATPTSGPPVAPATRRRRRWAVAGVVTAAVLVVLAVCTAGGLAVAAVDRATDRQDDRERRVGQTDAACLALEQRLNRVSPPGAALDLRRRAAAIRDENAALRPFIEQIDAIGGTRHVDHWRQLLAARITYADALDRQAGGAEPAFFLPPQTERGESVTERLEDGPRYCAGAVRRLAAPDL